MVWFATQFEDPVDREVQAIFSSQSLPLPLHMHPPPSWTVRTCTKAGGSAPGREVGLLSLMMVMVAAEEVAMAGPGSEATGAVGRE